MRGIVVVYGNCQAQVLAQLMGRIPSLERRFAFVNVTDTVEPGGAPQVFPHEAARATLVWEQYDQRPHLALRDELRACVRPGTPVYRFPGIAMHACWPFRARDPRNQPEPLYPWGRFPIGDRIALEIAARGLTGPHALQAYLERSKDQLPDIRHVLQLERASARKRDAACDVGMSDYIFERFRDTWLFWTFGHLGAPVYRELILRLLGCSVEIFGPVDGSLRAEVDAVAAAYGGQGELQTPIHPLVAEHLGLEYVRPDTTYRWYGQQWTFDEYTMRYIAFDRSW